MDNIEKATKITKYLSFEPDMRIVYALIFILPLIAGVSLTVFANKSIEESILKGYTTILLPGILTMVVGKIFIRHMKLKSIIISLLVFELIFTLSFSVSVYFFGLTEKPENLLIDIIAVSGVFTLLIWLAIGLLLDRLKTAFSIGIMQFLIFMLFVAPLFSVSFGQLLTEYAIISIVSISVIFILIYILLSPVKRNFSVSGFDALSGFVGQWYFGNDDLEDLFDQVGIDSKLPLGIMNFKNDKIYSFVVPYIHFGPFGKLGGSDAPGYIASLMDNGAIVMHSTATHDLNPTSRNEIMKIAIEAKDSLNNKFSDAKGAFIEAEYGNARIKGLVINDSILVSLTRAPYVTEDIDISVGYLIMEKLRKKFKNVIVADEHNSSAEKITSFEFISQEAGEYMKAADALLTKDFQLARIEAGFEQLKPNIKAIGSNGIWLALFKIGERKIGYIIIDGNGIARESKERLEAEMAKIGITPVIMTTDSHEKNAVSGVVNEITLDSEMVTDIIGKLSVMKLSQFSANASAQEMELKVLGPKQSIEIVSTVNSIVAMAKFMVPIAVLLIILFLLIVLKRL
ncbi:MAG: DUF2070 family protein [Candidatus Micrarchaeota archaeon]|nr:DUF2070 family protein [Candidatus Micrarchaeota archaeon]